MTAFFEFFIYLIIGCTAGFLSGLLGIGGGLVVVPSLLVIFHFLNFPPESLMQTAVGTSLSAMIFTAGSSAWAHRKEVNWYLFKVLVPSLFLGSILGSFIAHILPTNQLQKIFGLFVLLFGIYFFITAKREEIEGHFHPNYLLLSLIGLVIGGLSSILGIGGGLITVPSLAVFGVSLRSAISTSAVTGFFIAVIGTLSFLYLGLTQEANKGIGYVYGPAFIIIGLSAAFIAPWGARWAYKASVESLKYVFSIYLLIIGVLMLYF